MRKNCETCKHDDAEYPSYPHKTPCNECLHGKGCNDAPTKWEAAEHYKPDTNADRIRAMSDEELAEELHAIMLGWNEWCDYHCENRGDDGCDKCILKWLQQPAEEGADNG